MLLRKCEIRRCFVFPPHLSSGSALPCGTGNPEIASFHLNTVRCIANEHIKHMVHMHCACNAVQLLIVVELPFIPKVIDYMHQTSKTYLESEHSILLSVTRTLYIYQVCHSVGRCVKMIETCSSSCLEWKLMGCVILLSQQMSDASKHITDYICFLSRRQRIGAHALCVQHSPTAMRRSRLPFSWTMPPPAPSWTHWV